MPMISVKSHQKGRLEHNQSTQGGAYNATQFVNLFACVTAVIISFIFGILFDLLSFDEFESYYDTAFGYFLFWSGAFILGFIYSSDELICLGLIALWVALGILCIYVLMGGGCRSIRIKSRNVND